MVIIKLRCGEKFFEYTIFFLCKNSVRMTSRGPNYKHKTTVNFIQQFGTQGQKW